MYSLSEEFIFSSVIMIRVIISYRHVYFDQRQIKHVYYRIFGFIFECDDNKSQFWQLSPFEGIISFWRENSLSQYQQNPHDGVKLVWHLSYTILHDGRKT